LCPVANDFESDKDSLTDFIEKLAHMRSEGAVGDWNCTKVTSQYKSYLAVVLSDVWGEFDRRFAPNYSRQSIEQLIEGRGGKKGPQKFVSTKLECTEFNRARAAYHRGEYSTEPVRPVKKAAKKAILIPESELGEFEIDTSFSDHQEDIIEDNNESHDSSPKAKDDHPHANLIRGWVKDAGLTKEESQEIRLQLFGKTKGWKAEGWKKYTAEDMAKLRAAIADAGSAKQRDGNWVDAETDKLAAARDDSEIDWGLLHQSPDVDSNLPAEVF
jgi:hypothetical protein